MPDAPSRPPKTTTVFGLITLAGAAIMVAATIVWFALEPVQDSSIEEMYQMLLELVWACGGFLVAVAGLSWVIAMTQQRVQRRER